jgi:hypothetical protein
MLSVASLLTSQIFKIDNKEQKPRAEAAKKTDQTVKKAEVDKKPSKTVKKAEVDKKPSKTVKKATEKLKSMQNERRSGRKVVDLLSQPTSLGRKLGDLDPKLVDLIKKELGENNNG